MATPRTVVATLTIRVPEWFDHNRTRLFFTSAFRESELVDLVGLEVTDEPAP
jgi:hypothetical protein